MPKRISQFFHQVGNLPRSERDLLSTFRNQKEGGMRNLRTFLKMVFTPITIMLVPHSRTKPVSVRIPLAGILFSIVSFFAGVVYLFTVAVHTVEYYQMRERLSYGAPQC